MVTNSWLNYTGNKYKLLPQILPLIDYSKDNFVDLFCGGFVVGANVLDKYDRVFANDIIVDVVFAHRWIINDPSFVSRTKLHCPDKNSQNDYVSLRNNYNKDPTPEKLCALIFSCTNNMLRFNTQGKFNQTFGKRSFSDSTQKKIDDFLGHVLSFKDKITFSSRHFQCFALPQSSMVYIDPPYGYEIDAFGCIGKKQLSEAGYNAFWRKEDEKKLYDYCHRLCVLNHSFMLSGLWKHGDKTSWLINKLIEDGFNYKVLECDYDKVSRSGKKSSVEVVVINY